MSAPIQVTTWYLEMLDPSSLRPAQEPSPPVTVHRVTPPQPSLNRALYRDVGRDWFWRDRLAWDDARWRSFVDRPEVRTLVLQADGERAGYVELEMQPERNVEIAYFGIGAPFFGRGLGGWLLTVGIREAWEMGARRVWVHTCSLDHPAALDNYKARGMKLYNEETVLKEIPPALP